MNASDKPQDKNHWSTYTLWAALGLLALVLAGYYLFNDDPVNPAKKQLEAIAKNNDEDAYLNYVSSDFKDAASLNAFKTFLDNHPIFRKKPDAKFTVTEKNKNEATLLGRFTTKNGDNATLEYKMNKENGSWKIDTITFLDVPANTVVDNIDVKELYKPVEKQLEAIRHKNIHKAYYNLVSDEFQRRTTFKDFEKFISENPILANYTKKEIVSNDIDGNEGKLTLKLFQGPIETPIEYRLKRSKGEWKIWSLKVVVFPNNEASESPTSTKEIATLFEKAIEPIKDNNIAKAYYQSTTKSFRAQHSLENFQTLVKSNPAIKFGQPEFYQSFLTQDMAVFNVNLHDAQQSVLLKVSMRKENTAWKIDSLDISSVVDHLWADKNKKTTSHYSHHELIAEISPQELIPASRPNLPTTSIVTQIPPLSPTIDVKEVPQPQPQAASQPANSQNEVASPADTANAVYSVDQFLKSLRVGDPSMAYRSYTSEGFKDANQYDTFLNFVKTYSVLSTTTPKIAIQEVKNNYASINAELIANNSTAVVSFLLIKEHNLWKILAIDINIPKILAMPTKTTEKPKQTTGATATPSSSTTPTPAPAEIQVPKRLSRSDYLPTDLLPPVKQLLSSISHNDYSAAYQYYTSKGFQKNTSYDQFRKTMQRLPAVTQVTPTFSKPTFSGDTGLVSAKFASPYGTALFDFSLVYEDDQWKIQGLNVSSATNPTDAPTGTPITEKPNPLPPENLNPTSVEYPIQMQLYLITNNEINRSYFDLTSKSFQRLTNLQEYNDFITGYPVFIHNTSYSILSKNGGTDNDSFTVTLNSKQGETATAIYDLVKENNQWKILNIQIQEYKAPPKGLSPENSKDKKPQDKPIILAPIPAQAKTNSSTPTTEEKTSKLEFSHGAFGTSVNDEGLIQQPTLVLPKTTKNIYFNLYIENASQGDLISLNFKHLKSGTTIPEIRSNLRQDGNTTLSFIFAPPAIGWPEGIYEVTVTAQNGASKTFTFRIQ